MEVANKAVANKAVANKAVANKALAMLMVASVLTAGAVVEVPKVSAATPNAESDFTVKAVTGGVEITDYKGVSKDVVIPSTIGGKDVVSIGSSSFQAKQLTSVSIPGSVRGIGQSAFYLNKLVSVDIPDGATSIGAMAFMNNQLTSISIPGSVNNIEMMAFQSNQLTSVVLSPGVTIIGQSAFETNKITSLVLPEGMVQIGLSSFKGNQLTSVVIPGSVTTILGTAFSNNKLTSVVIPGITSIGADAFTGNQVTPADLTIWGVDPSPAKTHALAKGYTFNIKVPDPVVPDPTPGEGDSQTATLNLEGGDLTLETAEINDFGSIKLKNQPQTVTTGFDDVFTVTDNRGTGLGWRLDVSATQFSEVAPVGGFAGGAPTGFTLPIGSLMINGLDTIERTEGTAGGNPSISGLSNTVIDGSSLATVSNAGLNEGAGKFALTFGEDALSLVVDSSTAKVDTINYPTGATPYESTVTWDLVSAP